VVDQSQKTGPSDQSEESRISERRVERETESFIERFRHSEKRGDAAMYVMRKLKCFWTLDACKPLVRDLQNNK